MRLQKTFSECIGQFQAIVRSDPMLFFWLSYLQRILISHWLVQYMIDYFLLFHEIDISNFVQTDSYRRKLAHLTGRKSVGFYAFFVYYNTIIYLCLTYIYVLYDIEFELNLFIERMIYIELCLIWCKTIIPLVPICLGVRACEPFGNNTVYIHTFSNRTRSNMWYLSSIISPLSTRTETLRYFRN